MTEIPTFNHRPDPRDTHDRATVRAFAESLEHWARSAHPSLFDLERRVEAMLFDIAQAAWDAAEANRLRPPEERGFTPPTGDD